MHELIAGCNSAGQCAHAFEGFGCIQDTAHGPFRTAEVGLVHGGYKTNGIAHGGGIHIVLHKVRGHADIADFQGLAQCAGHAGIDDQLHRPGEQHGLAAHSGVYLADAALAQDDALAAQGADHVIIAALFMGFGIFNILKQQFDFLLQCTKNTDHLFHLSLSFIQSGSAAPQPGRRCRFPRPQSPCVRWWSPSRLHSSHPRPRRWRCFPASAE